MSFAEKLDKEGLEYFNSVCAKPFDQQAVAFLNAYWVEVGSQADFIFEVAFEVFQYADMHAKGIQYIHKYEMGSELDFNIGLYFYEQLCKKLGEPSHKKWTDDQWKTSQPEMMTAIKRKQELRDKVDVNFDNMITMIEYLLYQYKDTCNPADFVTRSMKAPDEHPEIKKARLALEAVNKRIKEYEAEKQRLEDLIENGSGVKRLRAKNMLAQLESGPLREDLNAALITAEAAVRIATKNFGKGGAASSGDDSAMPSEGALYWMNKDLEIKKKKYGRR